MLVVSRYLGRARHLDRLCMLHLGINQVLPRHHHQLTCWRKLSTAHSDLICCSLEIMQALSSTPAMQMQSCQQHKLLMLSAQFLDWSLHARLSIQSCKSSVQDLAEGLATAIHHHSIPTMQQGGRAAACHACLTQPLRHRIATAWTAHTHRQCQPSLFST